MTIRSLFYLLPAVALGATLSLPVSVIAQDKSQGQNQNESQKSEQQKNKQSRDAQQSKSSDQTSSDNQKSSDKGAAASDRQKKQTRQLKVFELEHRDPQRIHQLIMLCQQSSQHAQQIHAAAVQGRLGRAGVVVAHGSVGTPGSDDQQPRLVTAINAEKKILFVRGSEDQLQKVDELVKALDVANDKLEPSEYGDARLVPVKSSNAPQVQTALAQLELQGQLLNLGDMSLVVIQSNGQDSQEVEQAQQVIQKFAGSDQGSGDSSNSQKSQDSNK